MDEIMIHENQTDIYQFLNKGNEMLKFTIQEFNEQCMPDSKGESAKYDIRPNNTVLVDGVLHSIKTVNNEVIFEEILEKKDV